MRILIYSLNFAPELTGIGKYTGEMVEWLKEQGHELQVITAPPYYPAWRVGENYCAYAYKLEWEADTLIYRCPVWIPKHLNGAKRILHLLSFALSSLPIALWQGLWWRPDIVWLVAPNFCCAVGALVAARLSGGKAWLHIQDFEIDAAFDMGILKNQSLRKLILAGESWLMQRFDCVSTIAQSMLSRLKAKGVEPSQAISFPNWVDTELIYPLRHPASNPLRQALGIAPDQIVVLYAGNMGRKQGLEVILKTAWLLREHPQITFLMCGDGTSRQKLQDKAQALPNVKFLPLQPFSQLNNLLNLGDIHLLPQRADVADLVMPSKLITILASGGAVITTAYPYTELAGVVQESGGLVIPPGDAQQLADKILQLACDVQMRSQMQQQARHYAVLHFHKDVILKDFQAHLYRLCQPDVQDAKAWG